MHRSIILNLRHYLHRLSPARLIRISNRHYGPQSARESDPARRALCARAGRFVALTGECLVLLAGNAFAASVAPTGYTNNFAARPPATDWATFSRTGAAADAYDMDSDVNATITAGGVAAQTTIDANNPPTQLGTATWSSSGLYLQTRPTGNRFTALMGKFVNNTGTNATQITISYLFTIAAAGVAEEAGRGTRVYFSLSGAANSWTNLSSLNSTASAAGSSTLSTNLALSWTNGGSLYLLWADDNTSGFGTDSGDQVDNFSLQVTAGSPLELSCLVTGPTNNALFISGSSITAAAAVSAGTAPYIVEYFTNNGAGNTVFASAGSSDTAPYSVALGVPSAGVYNLYAMVWDSASNPTNAFSQTNTFYVADPITLILESPANDATIDSQSNVQGTATVSGGTAPYSVQFYLDNAAIGAPMTIAPFARDFGVLFVGDHTIQATVRDARGWASTSSVATVHITGPLAVLLAPTNGAAYIFGQPSILTAVAGGGSAPYSLTFFTNDQPAGTLSNAPFTLNLGVLSAGSYTCYVHAVDSSTIPQEASSTTNIITILPNPLVATLTSPAAGQNVAADRALTLAATVAVQAPITVSNVQFFFDGVALGVDNAAPFTASVTPTLGDHTVYAIATDSLGRTAYTATNQITAIVSSFAPSDIANCQLWVDASDLNTLTLSGNSVSAWADKSGRGNNATAGVAPTLVTNALLTGPEGAGRALRFNGTSTYLNVNLSAITGQPYTIFGVDVGTNRFFLGNAGFGNNQVLHLGYTSPTQFRFGQWGNDLDYTSPTNLTGSAHLWTCKLDTSVGRFIYLNGLQVANSASTATLSGNQATGYIGTRFNATEIFLGDLAEVIVYNRALTEVERAEVEGYLLAKWLSVSTTTAAITSPTNGANFAVRSPIDIIATANSTSSTVTQVLFYANGAVIGADTNTPYTVTWTNAPLGVNSLYVVAFDSSGKTGQSPTVTVRVLNDGVTLLTPVEDTMFTSNAPITVTAAAVLSSGIITNVEFYVDGMKFGEDAAAPFSATWSNVTSGSHRLTAIGRADTGAAYNSQPVNIGVASTLMVYGSVWKYLDNGSDQGTNWTALDFDDGSWASGPAPLGYGDSNGRLPATTNAYGPSSTTKYPTTYYRQAIVISNANAFSNIILTIERDDGAIVYLNGVEAGRFNMTTAAVNYLSYAFGNASDDGTTVFSTNINPARLVAGTNVLAVEIHQDAANSSDIWFRMQLIGLPVIIHNLFPTVALANPTNTQYYLAPPSISLEATAVDADGSVAKVEFFVDGAKVGEATSAPFSLDWNNPPVGAHLVTAVATDNGGAASTSVQVPIVVYDAAGRPVVKIISPLDGASMFGPTNLLLAAAAQAINGVTNVQFRANGAVIGNATTAPYAVVWPSTFFSNGLDAVAYDANGLSATSAMVSVFIAKIPPSIAGQSPPAGATLTNLISLSVTFNKPVQNVEAADLLINGVPATQVTPGLGGSNYLFLFSPPAYGAVAVSWATNHGITDTEPEQNPLDGTLARNTWSYTLVDQTPPAIAAQNPLAGTQVTNLTQIKVTFTEPVTGVDASDLLINGSPATSVSGSGTTYTFGFPQPNATLVNVAWAIAHGIRDQATTPNVFTAGTPGATWFYLTPDNVAPTLMSISPPAGATVRSLLQLTVVFNEPVTGVDTNDLLLNNRPARQVAGSGAGPYTFTYPQPSNGPVDVRWAVTHGIADLATPPNPFAGGQWTYLIDTNANFAGMVLINEIMFNPYGGRVADEWIELHNVGSDLINLGGWRFTRGLEFTFPTVSIPAGGFLVVAADQAAFKAKYPAVTNLVGGWTGQLANNDETIEIATALGEVVNRVHYASEGDWARREQGRGASLVSNITRSGSTATVTLFGHNFTANDRVMISGADQPEYNGIFVVASPSSATFTITVSGTPANATGRIICRQILDNNASGWSWFNAADGFGSSLELINPAWPNSVGQNWLTSTTPDGTPGRANSVLSSNVAPFIRDVTHFPPVPHSTDSVTISARVSNPQSNGVPSVTLYYRNHSTTIPPAFSSMSMVDDGAHNDGVANDGLYGATLSPQANGSVMEFYVQASGASGLIRTWPAPVWQTNNTFAQTANALFQVDNETTATNMPFLRLIMTESERSQLNGIDTASDAEMNATFISLDGEGTKIRYNAGVRLRGAGSRNGTPKNYRVNVPNDQPWNGRTRMNLNSRYVHAQLAGSVLSQRAGLPTEDARVVQVRVNGQNLGSSSISFGCYVLAEPMNGDWAANHFPLDPDGNIYRASRFPWTANLDYRGTDAATYQGQTGLGYYKASNAEENDWTDLIRLTFALSSNTSDADYVSAVRTNVNVEEWFLYFVVFNFFDSQESSLANGIGDDYAMYRGVLDPRFRLVGHDYDTILGQGDTAQSTNRSIWNMVDTPRSTQADQRANFESRFMRHPEFVPIYFRLWKQHLDTTFSPEQLNPVLDEILGSWVTGTTVSDMKTFAVNRRAYILTQIPTNLTVNSTLGTQNGYLYTTTPGVTLSGLANISETRRVLVNGTASTWSAWQGRWTNTVTLQPGINRVLVQSLDSNNVAFASATVEVWYDDGSIQTVSGTISADTIWTAAGGPYNVSGSLTISSGATLTIQPGTTLYLGSGVNITVASGGRLLAEGTATAPIRFSRTPGTANVWGGITVNGGAGSPETRIAYAHFEFNGATAIHASSGTVFLDHLTFGNTAVQYVSLDSSSFVVKDCIFPATTASFEPVHGTGGIKAGGRGIFLRNFWGKVSGYNDACDFTGGNRPGPIVQFINNVFMGSDDDLLDLDSTDAWVEGNILMHTHRNGSPDSSSAVSGGADNADTSQVTVIGNIIYDCDQAALAKQGNFFTLINNTIVHQNHTGSQDTNTAIVILADETTTQGAGMYLEGNIIQDAENMTRNVTSALVTFTNNLVYQLIGAPWSGPGGGNRSVDPMLKHIPDMAETINFTSWAQAQVMWDWFSLRPGSPGVVAGPNGRDLGAPLQRLSSSTVQPLHGVSLAGVPVGATPLNTAIIQVDPLRTGNGIPVAGWPNGSGFTHYKWRLDAGVWSAETPNTTPISLTGLSAGPHFVEVAGKNDAGFYQDDAVFDTESALTISPTWIVNPSASPLRLNEILASNNSSLNHEGTTPDVVEMHNASDTAIDLAGVRLTDDPANPSKFIFPVGASIPAGGYLVVYANNADGTSGHHLGFNLAQEGEAIYLYDNATRGGALLDSVKFGPQITDLSIGRLADGAWALTVPTFGVRNQAAAVGNPASLRLNEWLAVGDSPFEADFIELYNTNALPVSLGGLYLSDEVLGWRDRYEIPALSYISGFGYLRFIADGDPSQGAEHLNFNLSGDQGVIGLFMRDLTPIDQVTYLAQRLNVSQGRNPNGGSAIVSFDQATPGAPNPSLTALPYGGLLVINEVLANNTSLFESGRTPDWIELYNGTTTNVSLAGMGLTDETLQPRRFVFPAGTTLGSGGFLRVICDTGATNLGPLVNTNFALKSTGGGIYLFNGDSLVSSITYGLQVADLSIGRVPDGGANWFLCGPTPDAANRSVTSLGNSENLKVNEWMADPGPGKADWFELYNPDPQPVAIGGLFLTDDLNDRTKHQIAPLSFLGAGTNAWQKFVADNNTGAGADHVGFSLKVSGEAVGLFATNGTLINGVTFSGQTEGVSEGRFPDGSATIVAFPGTDSPGDANWRWLTSVVVNEALTHTVEPLEDAIELRNLTDQPLDISRWWLSDDNRTPQKFQIPSSTLIPPLGFAVIYEYQFTNKDLGAAIPFALSSKGDEIVLSAAVSNVLTGWRTQVKFGAADLGVAFGRYVTSDGREEFVAMSSNTFGVDRPDSVVEFRTGTGATNSYPRVGPVVISEIMYHPPDVGTNDNTRDEFIKLCNISDAPVPLYDGTNGWHLRDAVDFDFPAGTEIKAGASLLVVGFDPVNNLAALADFRSTFHLDTNTSILGPWNGKLANDNDDLELRRPGIPDTNGVDYILVEHVHYRDALPWPAEADGAGFSLQRLADNQFGNDPVNWSATVPSPGSLAAPVDADSDGLPDIWESLHGLDPANANDAALDTDSDGLSNLQEFQLGTDPQNPASGLRLNLALADGGAQLLLQFSAAAGHPYGVEYAGSVSGPWLLLQQYAAASTNRVIRLLVPTSPIRFYRLWIQPSSHLRLTAAGQANHQVQFTFNALAYQSYTVVCSPALMGANWSTVTNYPSAATDRVIQFAAPINGPSGFYLLRSP